MQNFSDFIMKCAIFEEHSSSCVVYSRFSGTLFPVSMIDGDTQEGELLRACCSENCLFGQRETNATGISSEQV